MFSVVLCTICRRIWSHFQPISLFAEVHGMACWHTVYIIISTSQQDTQGMCLTEDTAFSTFMLLVVLNFDQTSVNYTLQTTENCCQLWLSDSSCTRTTGGGGATTLPDPLLPTDSLSPKTEGTRINTDYYIASKRAFPTIVPDRWHNSVLIYWRTSCLVPAFDDN